MFQMAVPHQLDPLIGNARSLWRYILLKGSLLILRVLVFCLQVLVLLKASYPPFQRIWIPKHQKVAPQCSILLKIRHLDTVQLFTHILVRWREEYWSTLIEQFHLPKKKYMSWRLLFQGRSPFLKLVLACQMGNIASPICLLVHSAVAIYFSRMGIWGKVLPILQMKIQKLTKWAVWGMQDFWLLTCCLIDVRYALFVESGIQFPLNA